MIDLEDIFGKKMDSQKAVPYNLYTVVHADDNEAVAVIEPDMDKGPWIAGGAPLRWYQGQAVGKNDIDVFCRSAIQAQMIVDKIKSYGRFTVRFQSENAITLDYHSKDSRTWTIQIITRRYFSSMQEVLDNFDITVCAVGTCGNQWVLGPTTAKDIREKNIRFNQPLQPDALKRLVKYWIYGYRPVDNTVADIQSNPNGRWIYSGDEDYNNAF